MGKDIRLDALLESVLDIRQAEGPEELDQIIAILEDIVRQEEAEENGEVVEEATEKTTE